MDYKSITEKLGSRQSRKIANNTYLKQRGEAIAVMLHETDVVTFEKNGTIILNSGGWKTSTTKDRINQYSPMIVNQRKGIWYVNNVTVFFDGITIKNQKILNCSKAPKAKKIKKYVDDFMTALKNNKVEKPSGGDCWYCALTEVKTKNPLGECIKDNSHLKAHIKEKYFVPSLLLRAIEVYPISIIAKGWIGSKLRYNNQDVSYFEATAIRQVQKSLYRYIKKQFNLA